MKLKIALVQFETAQFFPEKNLKKAEEFIRKVSSFKANIVVFPEDFLVGPIVGREEFADSEYKYRAHFQSLAQKYKIDIVPGSIIEKENGRLYNTSYYIDSYGKIRARYRKINLWLGERKYLTPGNEVSVFNTKYGKIGLAICWDLIFPEIFRKMAKKGVNIVICPSWWYYDKSDIYEIKEIKLVDSLCTARAFENEIILVYCNAAGKFHYKEHRFPLIGHSQITAPLKDVIQRLNHNKEAIIVQEIDPQILKSAEQKYRIRKDLKNRILY